jgi:hypothetical protein
MLFYSIPHRSVFSAPSAYLPLGPEAAVCFYTNCFFSNWLPGGTTSLGTAFKQTVAVSFRGGGGVFGTIYTYGYLA